MSLTTVKAFFIASAYLSQLGRLWAGLVVFIHIAFMSPFSRRMNMSTAGPVGLVGICSNGTPHTSATSLRCCSLTSALCPGRMWVKPPCSLVPPQALGCPVRLRESHPGLPILPVSRCRL